MFVEAADQWTHKTKTVSTMLSFFLAMALHPSIQHRAQAEIDALTGGSRLPTFGDRENLPFIEAILKELHRWNPVVPLGMAPRPASPIAADIPS